MAITVGLRLEHLPIPNVYPTVPPTDQSRLLLAPNLPHTGTVKATLKAFVKVNLFIPEEQQLLVAPVFTKLSDGLSVEEVYRRYACQADREDCELYVDEESLTFFGRENGKTIQLADEARLDECNILDKSVIQLRKAPQPLSNKGGRMFVDTKDGILPLQGISGLTRVSAVKEAIEKHTGIPKSQQLLSSIGRVMHDEFYIKDFDGVHAIYEDSIIDLTVSGDKNSEQAHRRMLITVNVVGHEEFSLVVQGRDLVQGVMNVVEARTGIPLWQQRVSFSGKSLQDKKTLAEYFIFPQCTLQVTAFKSPLKTSFRPGTPLHSSENQEGDPSFTPAARKLKMVRTCKGLIAGTIIIPVLTSDTVGDLRRKVKRSLRPLEERNFSIGTPPRAKVGLTSTPGTSLLKPRAAADNGSSSDSPAAAAHKLPPPPLDHCTSYGTPRIKLVEAIATPERYETPRARIVLSPQTPQSCYETPPATISSTGTTNTTRCSKTRSTSTTTTTSAMDSPSSRGSRSARRLLRFGVGESPQRNKTAMSENVEDKINKALVHIVNTGAVENVGEKQKGIGAWLKQIKVALH